jgi:hypothetical protein
LTEEARQRAIRAAWLLGKLRYKLSPLQRDIKDWLSGTLLKFNEALLHIGRQTGKTFTLNVVSIEECVKKPNSIVAYVAPIERKLASFIKPILDTILKDCPDDLRPVYLESKNQLVFSNGSVIHYFGSHNDNHNAIRGLGSVTMVVLDEAGFLSNLLELVAVVSPMLLRTKGNLVFSSSSPESVDHPFVALIEQAQQQGWYLLHPTWDDKTVTEDQFETLARQLGGRDSTRYRREVGCELVVEKTKQVLPEWDNKYVYSIEKSPVYKFFHHFVAFDPGFKDPSSVTFATYLFGTGTLYIEDEIVIPGRDITIDKLAAKIQSKVIELWPGSERVSYWADPSNQTLLDELGRKYKLYFSWTAKDKKRQYLEALRAFIAQGSLVLDPRCKLHATMFQNTIWKDDHSEFERSASGFHGDCIDSTLYLYRNLNVSNPIPQLNGIDLENNFIKSVEQMSETKQIAEWVSGGLDDAMQQDTTGKDQGSY